MMTTKFKRKVGTYYSSRRRLGDLGLGLGVCCAGERVLKSEQHCSDRARGWFVLEGLNAVGLGCLGTVALGHLSQDGSVHTKKTYFDGFCWVSGSAKKTYFDGFKPAKHVGFL